MVFFFYQNGTFKAEIVPVVVKDKKKEIIVDEDEEYKNVKFDKITSLKPAFQADGMLAVRVFRLFIIFFAEIRSV